MPNLEYLVEKELIPELRRIANALEALVEVTANPVYIAGTEPTDNEPPVPERGGLALRDPYRHR